MNQSDIELQLKVWKELAINKQVLMQTAATALGLKAECSSEELESALKATIEKAKKLESALTAANEKSSAEITELKDQLKRTEAQREEERAAKESFETELKASEDRVVAGRQANADELKKIKVQLADKQKELKQITKTLADTPENVVKKMKALKKEKMDEANDRKRAEENSRNLKKEKQRVEQDLKESQALVERAGELVSGYRELHKIANEQFTQLAEKVEDKDALTALPEVDEAILEAIENANSDEQNKGKSKK
ncbi:hypothetical protein [Aliikangiella maris]|uniref:Uncharacterized protein n=2 Tax=Aliikangiella maris TaxID=3162458 RepID=A0ABV2BT41_9GAMM